MPWENDVVNVKKDESRLDIRFVKRTWPNIASDRSSLEFSKGAPSFWANPNAKIAHLPILYFIIYVYKSFKPSLASSINPVLQHLSISHLPLKTTKNR